MFLLGGNTMPGTEKFWGELLFPEEKMVVFFNRREKKQFFLRETNVLLRVFLYQAYCFQPEGYIFLGFHPLTYHKPLDFDGFCFILPLQILLISWPIGLSPAGAAGDPKGAEPLWPQWDDFFNIVKKATTRGPLLTWFSLPRIPQRPIGHHVTTFKIKKARRQLL